MSPRRGPRHLIRFARWWGALMGLWLLLTGTLDPIEVATGAFAAAIGALAASLVQGQEIVRFYPRAAWLLRVVRIPRRLLVDNWIVLSALVLHVVGRKKIVGAFRSVSFRAGGEDTRSATRRALVISALTMTPNSLVVGIDEDNDLILCHQLVPSDPSEARDEILGWL